MTITEALRVEHAMFCAMFEQIENDLPHLSLAETKRIAALVESMVQRHGNYENEMALAALNHALAEKGQLDRLHFDHYELDSALHRVQEATDDAEARHRLQEGLQALRQHMEHEEHSVFPLIERVVPAKVLKDLGKAYLLHKASGAVESSR